MQRGQSGDGERELQDAGKGRKADLKREAFYTPIIFPLGSLLVHKEHLGLWIIETQFAVAQLAWRRAEVLVSPATPRSSSWLTCFNYLEPSGH